MLGAVVEPATRIGVWDPGPEPVRVLLALKIYAPAIMLPSTLAFGSWLMAHEHAHCGNIRIPHSERTSKENGTL